MLWLVSKQNMMKIGEDKREKNVIFHCLDGVKIERKENRALRVFHQNPPFFYFQIQMKKKNERK